MKKCSIILMLFTFVFIGCSSSTYVGNDFDTEQSEENYREHNKRDKYGENDDLMLQLTKQDKKAGITKEDEKYQQIVEALRESPKLGVDNEFNFFTINVGHTETGHKLLLAGINRFPMAVHNVSFDFTLRSEEGEHVVYEDIPIHLTESEMGTFQPNGVMPVLLDLSSEQLEQYNRIDAAEVKLELNNFEYETDN